MPSRQPPRHLWTVFGLLLSLGLGSTWLLTRDFSIQRTVAVSDELLMINANNSKTANAASADTSKTYGHRQYFVEGAIAHVVMQPPNARLSIAVSESITPEELATSNLASLAPIETFSEQFDADYIINGGFFDPNNGKTTSHLVSRGQIVGDPADNERLVENPNLTQYLPLILNRSEFRIYHCQKANGDMASDIVSTPIYDITFHDAPPPDGCEIDSAIGAGPQLLPINTSKEEGFTDYKDGALTRDAVGSLQPNARSAIGIGLDGVIALIMVEKNASSSGMTLLELADFASSLGITRLLNLDGGSSSALFVAAEEKTYFGFSDTDNNPVRRPVKSVVLLSEPDS